MTGPARKETAVNPPGSPRSRYVSTEIRHLPAAVVCQIAGPAGIDRDTAPAWATVLYRALGQVKPPQELCVGLAGVDLFTAAGLNVLLELRDAAAVRRVPLVLDAPSDTVVRTLRLADAHTLFTIRPAATAVSAAVDPALNHLRQERQAGRWTPTPHDQAVLAGLLPRLEWADTAQLPRLARAADRATRMRGAAADLAIAALSTRGELATLLSRYATALAPLDTGDSADPDGTAAQLTDAGNALRRLIHFLQALHRPVRSPSADSDPAPSGA